MKNIFFIVFLYLVTPSNAQNKFPKGSYMNIDEIVKKSPSKKMDLTIQKRSKGDIKMNGGNDFKLTSTDQSISNKEIKKKILAYSNGDSLYINGHIYKVQKWYAPVIKYGRYLVFVGGISQEEHLYNYQIQETNSATFWSSFGAIGGGIQGVESALLRFPYWTPKKMNY